MYCVKHDIFWNYMDSWFCPVCFIEYDEKIKEIFEDNDEALAGSEDG